MKQKADDENRSRKRVIKPGTGNEVCMAMNKAPQNGSRQ
jgi:hypothetical protein